MNDPRRYRREDPARTDPIRDRTYRGSEGGPAGLGFEAPPGREAGGPWSEVVSEAVDLGYRVVEEQIRLGQRVAEGLTRRRYGPAAMTEDFRVSAERVLDLYSQAGQLWFDLLTSFWGGDRRPRDRDEESARGGEARAGGNPPLSFQLTCSRPVRATLEVRPGCAGRSLATPELRAFDREKPPLLDVSFETGGPDDLLRVRIDVPPGQPSGSYHGVVLDRDTGRLCGTLTVQVSE